MERYEIQKLRELPIEAVAQRLGLNVKSHRALCPFHDDSNPSLHFSVRNNSYKCFVCNNSGGVIDLAMGILGKSFPDACRWLANEHNIIIEQRQPAVKPARVYPPDLPWLRSLVARPHLCAEAEHFLFNQRHYDRRVVQWLGISSITQPTPCWHGGRPYYDAPSLLFPYRNMAGEVMSLQSRYLGAPGTIGANGFPIPRFRFLKGSECHVFNLPVVQRLKPGEQLFLSEGITDCIALLSSGHKSIAIPSATLLKVSDLQPLVAEYNARNWHIYPDHDDAGENLYRQLVRVANELGACLTRHDLPEGIKDYSDLYLHLTRNS